MTKPEVSLPVINLIKAIASQLILWHHFALYGPLQEVLSPLFDETTGWLADYGRLAVPAFLVTGGFLAARSLLFRTPGQSALMPGRLIARRYWRLMAPYCVALLFALLAAAVARALGDDASVPAKPSLGQLISHLLLLQDIVGLDALSAGVWYVAIDFQLYALLVLIAMLFRRHALEVCAGLTVVSLFWLNRYSAIDMWAPYFFAAYGLGIVAAWIARQRHRVLWMIWLMLAVSAALEVEWRSRILVAGATAMLLAVSSGRMDLPAGWQRALNWLGSISFAVFLTHYPVLLLVGAVFDRLWPQSVPASAVGVAVAWLMSMISGHLLYRFVETRSLPFSSRRPAASTSTV